MMHSGSRDNNGGSFATTPQRSLDTSPGTERQRNIKHSLYQNRPRTASGESSAPSFLSSPASPSRLPPLLTSPIDHSTSNSLSSQRSFPSFSTTTSDAKPYPALGIAQPILNHKPSQASRLRALDTGTKPHPSEGSPTPDYQDYSRPRQASGGLRKEPSRPSLKQSNTFPLRFNDADNITPPPKFDLRERGLSTSSSRSAVAQPVPTLRPTMSIPDYHAADSIYTRQRNLNSATYRPTRGPASARYEPDYNSYRREPSDPSGFEEEIRASIRSALTTDSSFMGTSGTERSSVLTRSSSATSIFAYSRDEGMSVDDAIGMYESGFQDSGVEDNEDGEDEADRPETSASQRERMRGLHEAISDDFLLPKKNTTEGQEGKRLPPSSNMITPSYDVNDDLAPPRSLGSAMLIRDSTSFFKPGGLDTPKASPPTGNGMGFDGNVDIEEGYFSGKTSSRPGTNGTQVSLDPTRDRYGFKKATQYTTMAEFDAWNGPYTEYLARRKKKWMAMQKASSLITTDPDRFPPKSVKMKRFVRKGIPPEWRGAAWFYYAGGPEMVAKQPGVYESLVKRAAAGGVAQHDDEIIERDLNRTFPDNIRFKPDALPGEIRDGSQEAPETPIIRSLRRVLQAFSIHNPKIGYCQSTNFIAGLLLLFMDEEKSFWMLNIITRIYLPGTHDVNLEGANVDLGVFMAAVKEMMPTIWTKIGGELDGTFAAQSLRLPPITLCTSAWFMSCFIGTFPIETTLRVWDSCFYEGSKTLFRIALTILKIGEPEIKAVSDPMEIFQVVQGIPRRLIDANLVMESCFKRRNGFGHISQETIEKGRVEWRKAYALERERNANGLTAPMSQVRPPGRKNTLFSRKRRGPSE